MKKTFFEQICSKAQNSGGENYETAVFLHLDSCSCDGANFYGMPEVQFELGTNGYGTDNYYLMKPAHFELFPKIDELLQEQYCNLGFWSLYETFPNQTNGGMKDEFALGQNFIRDSGIIYNWVQKEDGSTDLSLLIGKAPYENSILEEIVVIFGTLTFLIAYVAYFTVLKFRRIDQEEIEYNKIKKLVLTDETKLEVIDAIKNSQADKDYV